MTEAHGWSPNHYCPECGQLVERSDPAWVESSGQLHHDPCPGGFRCHWQHDHAGHYWTPLVADPDHPRVLYLMSESVWCPGEGGSDG